MEADVRVVQSNIIHRITPRFKSLLHELHYVGNLSHPLINFYLPVFMINGLCLLTGIMEATFNGGGGTGCVPAWMFCGVVQPLVTFIVWIHAFGNLNLGVERDLDQDIVEMNIRLTYSDSHVPNW